MSYILHREGERFMRWILCIALGLTVAARPALAAVELARPADAFVDSIGVNTHYGNSIYTGGNAYADPAVDAKLAALGVRHIRDHSYNNAALVKIDGLFTTYGIRANLILGETSRSPADLVNLLKAHPGYEAIEGLNEPDFNTRSYNSFTDSPSANNYSATRAFQNDMFTAINNDPLTQNVMVLSPAMGDSSKSQFLPPISFDFASMHSYPSAREPTFNLDTKIGQMATLRGSPVKPLMSTETGYYNEPAVTVPSTIGDGSIPENISGKYMPRLYAEYFNRGVTRTYGYEFADQGQNTANREENFGLIRFNMTEKPAYTAMKNVIDLIEEPGTSFTPASLDYTLSSNPTTLHHTLLQKSNGTFYLMLWQEVPCYNRFAESELTNAPLSITLTLNTQIALGRTYLPNGSINPTNSWLNPASMNLSVPDQMLVVELVPAPEPSWMVGTGAVFLVIRRRVRGAAHRR